MKPFEERLEDRQVKWLATWLLKNMQPQSTGAAVGLKGLEVARVIVGRLQIIEAEERVREAEYRLAEGD